MPWTLSWKSVLCHLSQECGCCFHTGSVLCFLKLLFVSVISKIDSGVFFFKNFPLCKDMDLGVEKREIGVSLGPAPSSIWQFRHFTWPHSCENWEKALHFVVRPPGRDCFVPSAKIRDTTNTQCVLPSHKHWIVLRKKSEDLRTISVLLKRGTPAPE